MAKDTETGRQARTKGVSVSPEEADLVTEFESLTGLGFTDQVRQSLFSKLPAAVALIRDMKAAGMETKCLPIEQVVYAETAEERQRLYEDTFEPADAHSAVGVG